MENNRATNQKSTEIHMTNNNGLWMLVLQQMVFRVLLLSVYVGTTILCILWNRDNPNYIGFKGWIDWLFNNVVLCYVGVSGLSKLHKWADFNV